jgi:hypothetical protein
VVLTYQLPHELEPRRLSRERVRAKLEETAAIALDLPERSITMMEAGEPTPV